MMMCPTGKVSLLTGLAGKKIHFLSFWATEEMMCEGVYLRSFSPLHIKFLMSTEIVWIVDAVLYNYSETVYQHLIRSTVL